MKIVQSTWNRFWHFDLARELQAMGHLERIFTCLPTWKVKKESREQQIPLDKISYNFFMHGVRHVAQRIPGYSPKIDFEFGVWETKMFAKWVSKNLPECDTYIGISGSGLLAGRVAQSRGACYFMDRGSTQCRYANNLLQEEHRRWGLPYTPVHPWLIENEEAEAEIADVVTVPSHFVRQTFIDQGTPPAKVKVVPYGVSLKEFYPVDAPPADCFRLVFVGQFSLRKGAPYLLEAFKAFKHTRKELVVVGAVQDEMKPLINSIGSENIRFVGTVARTEVKKYLSAAHAMVLPSIEEGLALVQGQAMACGCPVIATPNTGSETLYRHGKEGLIIEASNVKALTAAFNQLAEDEIFRHNMSQASLQRVKELGGWRTYAEGMVAAAKKAKDMQEEKFIYA